MNKSLYAQTLALSGVIQACQLVYTSAIEGKIDNEAFKASIHSLYETHPISTAQVYGGEDKCRVGLTELSKIYRKTAYERKHQILRYVIFTIAAEKKLSRSATMVAHIQKQITAAQEQANYFHETHITALTTFSKAYTDTVGTFNKRLQVIGKEQFMSRPNTMETIRALLLAGIRSAILLKQVGGTPWTLLLKRKSVIAQAESILSSY